MPDARTTLSEDPRQVSFDGGCLGSLFVLFVSVAAVFAIAAFDNVFVASLADLETYRNIFAAIAPLRIGSVNIGALLIAGGLGWKALGIARRFVGGRAVWIDGDIIRFHPTVRRLPLALGALEQVLHEAGEINSVLWLVHSGGMRIKIDMVDPDAAQAFVAEAERARAELAFS